MVMKPEPWTLALESVVRAGGDAAASSSARTAPEAPETAVPAVVTNPAQTTEPGAATSSFTVGKHSAAPVLVVPSPAGEVFTQRIAYELAAEEHLIFACGRYEGIDERFIEWARDEVRVRPLSLGDYVLNGGEVAVLAMVEAVTRLVPGVIGNPESLDEESHTGGLLEYPVYTKPAQWRERTVPDTLLSGHHGRIARWRRDQQLERTARRRPDMVLALDPATLDRADLAVLAAEGFTLRDGQWQRCSPAPSEQAPEGARDMA